jgi:gluconate 5-dehydrogenase
VGGDAVSVRALFDLGGKVALVTGGSRGLGLQIAEGLGELGATVVLTARKREELDAACAHLTRAGIRAHAVVSDQSRLESLPDLADGVAGAHGTIDILVNNAGTNWASPAEDFPAEAWRKVMALNLDAVWYLTQAVAKRVMIPRRQGKIINIASIAGLSGNPVRWEMHTIAYNTSKGAVVNMTRQLASEWGRYGINVNCICPGFFRSKMTDVYLDRMGERVIEDTPLGRLGGEEDLKGAVVFLASEASRMVTGHALPVDGGGVAV